MLRLACLLMLVPFFARASGAALWPWIVIDKTPYLTLETWEARTQFHVFVDEPKSRILFERKSQPDLILLLDSPYALQGGRFLALPQSPLQRGGKILISAESAERLFLPVLPLVERTTVAAAIQGAHSEAGGGCLNHHRVQRIFLDPGHGGDDLGTKKAGIKEKDVVLKFSRLVADELRRRGFVVSFSRTRDVFVPLEIRPKLAKEWKADLFVSIHVNSSPAKEAQGTETYILSQEATDAAARKLALLENSIAGKAEAKASAVQDILWDVEQTAYLQDSAYLAADLQNSIIDNAHDILQSKKFNDQRANKIKGGWKNRGVRQAPFYVLNRAAMPAVLVEIGYLSNPKDRQLMNEKIFQESLAKALAEGVKKYRQACHQSP